MNLLRDSWIPVQGKAGIEFLRLKDLLCSDGDWHIETHRDDLNVAALQLVICLVQVCLQPSDGAGLRARESAPMAAEEYDTATEPFVPWFNLVDARYPFMQMADTSRGELKSLQKLLVGMPEATADSPSSNAFFHHTLEIREVSLPLAGIMLFQQATNGVGLGGSFFAKPLKGDAPLTTLVYHTSLRRCVWRNVLCGSFVPGGAAPGKNDRVPTWVLPVETRSTGTERDVAVPPVSGESVRALFWQPARVLLDVVHGPGVCDITGTVTESRARGFFSEPRSFGYKGASFCRHPHSPVRIREDRTMMHMKWPDGISFWRDGAGLFWENAGSVAGVSPARVVSQYAAVWFDSPVTLALSGYVADNQKIDCRRHETYTMPAGWPDQMEHTRRLLDDVVAAVDAVGTAGYVFAKNYGKAGWDRNAIRRFADLARSAMLARVEPLMQRTLREIAWDRIEQERRLLVECLRRMAFAAFKGITAAYTHSPSGLLGYVRGVESLRKHMAAPTEAAA